MKPTLFLPLAALLALSTLAVTQDAPDAARDQPSAKAQERIVKEVGHQLRMLPYVGPFDYLGARVDGFTVMLFGQVVKPVNKSDAESAVKHIEGVEKVDNRIEVLPPSPMDHGIRRSMYRAIYGYPALQRYSHVPQKPIRIIVKGGHVTLEGVVDSEADKNLAGIRANGVPNVFSVTNNLQVEKP
jgi:hyperosmotically inducible protein